MAHLRTHIDDDPAALHHHQPSGRLGDHERRSDIQIKQQVESLFVDLEEGRGR